MNKLIFYVVAIAIVLGLLYLLSTTCATPEYKGDHTDICMIVSRWELLLFNLVGYKI